MLHTTGPAVSLAYELHNDRLLADGEDCAVLTAYAVDAESRFVPDADGVPVRFDVAEHGTLLAAPNSAPTDHRRPTDSDAFLWNGCCQLIVRSDDQPGDLVIRASSPQLGSAEWRIPRVAAAPVPRVDPEDPALSQQLRKGDTSIHKAYTEIMNKEHEGETRACERCQQEKPFSDFRLPSNRKNVRPICKECEAKAKQAAKEAEIAASLPVPPEVSGIGIKDGQTAHISLGLPDNPAMFEQMIALLQHAQDAYIASFKSTIAQYRPSMISEDHTNMIMEMIDNIANDTEEILNTHLKEVAE